MVEFFNGSVVSEQDIARCGLPHWLAIFQRVFITDRQGQKQVRAGLETGRNSGVAGGTDYVVAARGRG